MDVVFHQVEVGPMANYNYLVGHGGQAAVVDPAWEVDALLDLAGREGLAVTRVLLTHTHPDHIGGDYFGTRIPGLAALVEANRSRLPALLEANRSRLPRGMETTVYVHPREAEAVKQLDWPATPPPVVETPDGAEIAWGELSIRCLHTPGHTPGSQCFLFNGRLITGDTLFIGACGRTDLPGGDPGQLYDSLTGVLALLPDETLVFPGHNYAPPAASTTIGGEKSTSPYFRFPNREAFIRAMG
ncbi:MAG: MBL fold metallo-hydrolase [Deltaproteobacteria bacterium]|nr:MBL fold metallo-hydrolase [Deltaproteobacteria bacterium]